MKPISPTPLVSTTIILILALNTPVLADGPDHAPAPTSVAAPSVDDFEWTGFYVGGSIGRGSSNYEIDGSYSNGNSSPPISASINLPDLGGDGMIGSVRVGYDYQRSESLIVGASIDASFSDVVNDTNLNLSANFAGEADAETLNFEYELSPSKIYTIAGRVGYLANETTMLYSLLGYSRGTFEGNLSGSLTVDGNPAGNVSSSYDFELDGVTVGFGIDTMLAGNLGFGIEYRYTSFDRYRFYDGPLIGGGDNVEVGFDTAVQSVQALLNYRF